jgi:hypothetical protein
MKLEKKIISLGISFWVNFAVMGLRFVQVLLYKLMKPYGGITWAF